MGEAWPARAASMKVQCLDVKDNSQSVEGWRGGDIVNMAALESGVGFVGESEDDEVSGIGQERLVSEVWRSMKLIAGKGAGIVRSEVEKLLRKSIEAGDGIRVAGRGYGVRRGLSDQGRYDGEGHA